MTTCWKHSFELKAKRERVQMMQNPENSACSTQANWKLHSPEGEPKTIIREIVNDYVPMDVYIDPQTIERHFQRSPSQQA